MIRDRSNVWSPFRLGLVLLIVVLALLCSAALAQAQSNTLPAPENGIRMVLYQYNRIPPVTEIFWDEVPEATGYELFIKGKGKWKIGRSGGWRAVETEMVDEEAGLSLLKTTITLEPRRSYKLRIRAVDENDNKGAMTRRYILKTFPRKH